MSGECEKCNEHCMDCQCDEDATMEELEAFAIDAVIRSLEQNLKEMRDKE